MNHVLSLSVNTHTMITVMIIIISRNEGVLLHFFSWYYFPFFVETKNGLMWSSVWWVQRMQPFAPKRFRFHTANKISKNFFWYITFELVSWRNFSYDTGRARSMKDGSLPFPFFLEECWVLLEFIIFILEIIPNFSK